MRSVTLTVLAGILLLLAAALLEAGEPESELAIAERTLRAHELTIHLLEKRVRSQERLADRLFKTLEKEFEALEAARLGTTAGVDIVKRQILDLQAALEAEQERNGLAEDVLGKQLTAERQRHTQDVVQLQGHLATVNEMAERNRLGATQALQRAVVVEEEKRRLRDHFVHAVRLLGEIGPAAKVALPWLKKTEDWGEAVLAQAARTATARIRGEEASR